MDVRVITDCAIYILEFARVRKHQFIIRMAHKLINLRVLSLSILLPLSFVNSYPSKLILEDFFSIFLTKKVYTVKVIKFQQGI